MTEAIIFRFRGSEIRQLEEAIEAWKSDSPSALTTYFAQDLVAESLKLKENVIELWKQTRGRLTRAEEPDIDAVGLRLEETFDRSRRVLQTVAELAAKFAVTAGHAVEGADRLGPAVDELSALATRVLQNWPRADLPLLPVDRQMIEAYTRAFQRGEGEDLKTLLDRVQNGGGL
jgi:hypothetical protein